MIPRPRRREDLGGEITWTSPLRIRADPACASVVGLFVADLAASVGWEVRFDDAAAPDLQVGLDERLAAEGYRLSVDATTVVAAGDAAGAAHALTTLRQLGPDAWWSATSTTLDEAVLARTVIDDAPDFEWRGVHLDVARHFFPVATVLRLIDLAAAHKLNRLHLHLNDDQGWRVEVPAWPRLTRVGAYRSSSRIGHECDGVDDHLPHGGFYRAEDLVRIREHAARRHVVVVPEIDLPGHAQAALAAYPELGNTGEQLEVWTRWGISEHVLNVEPATLSFARDVVSYVAELFPDSPVHIGGDECPTGEWERSPRAHAVAAEHGLSDVTQLQGLFTRTMSDALAAAGHEVVAWDEVLDHEVAPGTVIAAWRDSERGALAARRGLDVVMCPMQYVYLDWANSAEPGEPVAITRPPEATTWERVYGFSVVPETLEDKWRHHVRGAQANVWTEYIATEEHLDYMVFPRLAAFSEVVWGTTTSLEEFRPRLVDHEARLRAMGVAGRGMDAR